MPTPAVRAIDRVPSAVSGDRAAEVRSGGGDVLDLRGSPVTRPAEHVLEAARAATRDNIKATSRGLVTLREAIAEKLARENGIIARPDGEILVTNGGMQAVWVALQALLEPGDEILLHSPGFFFDGIARLVGGRLVWVPTRREEGYRLHADLERYCSPRTRVLLLNTPTNPTGYTLTREAAEDVAAFAVARNLWIVSDESYEKMVYDGGKHLSIGSLPAVADRTLTVHSFTKAYALPGWRVGFVAGPAPVIDACHAILEWTVITCGYVAQKAAEAALTGPQGWIQEISRQLEANRNAVVAGLGDLPGLEFATPKGGPFLFPDVTAAGTSAEDVAQALLARHGIPTTPGRGFDAPGHLRLPFGATATTVQELVRRFRPARSELISR